MSEQFFTTRDGNLARFRREPALAIKASRERRTSVFDQVTILTVTSPGLTKTEFSCEIHRLFHDGTERRNERYWHEYGDLFEQWAKGAVPVQSGTPLEVWDGIRPNEAAAYKAKQVHTVEALAGLPDSALDHLGMGARALRDKARAFVANGPAAEVARLRAEIEEMKKAMTGGEAPARRGRPPKAAAEASETEAA